jgi:hypothetical protein
MIKEYKDQILKSLGVYELRELARSIGVESPTTKKRKQLEQEIIKISKGELEPKINTSRKGRPPKSIKKVEGVLDVFVPKELLAITLNRKVDNKLESLIRLSSNEIVSNEVTEISGYLRKTISGYHYFRNRLNPEEFVSVPNIHIENFSLIEGDRIAALCKKQQNENYYNLVEITKVNKEEPSKEKRELLNIDNIVLSETEVKGFEGVHEGQSVFLITEDLKSGIEKIKNALSSLSEEYHIVFLAPSVSTYTKLLIEKDFNAELIYSIIEDHPAYVYDNVINAGKHVDVLLKENKKVVAVVFDMFTIINSIKNFFVLENQKHTAQEDIEAVRIVRKIFNYGKALESGASITTFGHCLVSETEDLLFKNAFAKLADKTFYL